MIQKYRVVFYGVCVGNEVFKARMIKLGVSPQTVEMMLRKAPVVLKQDLDLASAARYADAVGRAGGDTEVQLQGLIQEPETNAPEQSPGHCESPVVIAPFKNFVMCPQCGLKQPKGPSCVKCGHGLIKDDNHRKPENVAGH